MGSTDKTPDEDLRQQAKALLKEDPKNVGQYESLDLREMLDEIHIYHAELEVQNEELRDVQEQLTKSRDNYWELYDFAPVGYCTLSRDGRIEQINVTGADMLGVPRRNAQGDRLRNFLKSPGAKKLRAMISECENTQSKTSDELQILQRDGAVIDVHVDCTIARNIAGATGGFRLALTDVTRLKQSEHELEVLRRMLEHRVRERTREVERQADELRALAAELTWAEQRARRKLADELHDYLAQTIALANMKLQAAPPNASVEATLKLLDEAYQYTRVAITNLSAAVFYERGLCEALNALARDMRAHGLRVEVKHEDSLELPEHQAVLIYQSVRELLFNVLKYSGVEFASVECRIENGIASVAVVDHGAGFDPAKLPTPSAESGKFGLFSIRERMKAMGGSCTLESQRNEGTRITMSIPLEKNYAENAKKAIEGGGGGGEARFVEQGDQGDGITVFVIDDHEMMREGLCDLLAEQKGIRVVGEAASGVEAFQKLEALQPKAVLVDFNLKDMNGVEVTREIKTQFPHTVVIGLSVRNDDDAKKQMLDAGAAAYIVKGGPVSELFEGLRSACGRT